MIFYDSKKRYGAPKIQKALIANGTKVSLKRVQRHMVYLGLRSIVKSSRRNYGTRKIKVELKKLGFQVSRRRIGRIMKQEGLVSKLYSSTVQATYR